MRGNEFREKINKYGNESRFGVDISFVSVCRPILVGGKEARRTYDRQSFIFSSMEDKTKISTSIPLEGGESFRVKGGGRKRTFEPYDKYGNQTILTWTTTTWKRYKNANFREEGEKKKKKEKTMKPMVILNLYEEFNAIKNHFPCLGEILPPCTIIGCLIKT